MIGELRVRELGVIADVDVVFGPGLTAITGETGAGKTLIVEALELLLGGRGDAGLVRFGATEAVIEGRFEVGEEERILCRVLPANGRSRALIDDKMASVASLEELGRDLVDLHGQHAHQSLLRTAAQRQALDDYAGVDLTPLRDARGRLAAVEHQLAERDVDERARLRELDLLRFELEEIEHARIVGPDEDTSLEEEEGRLAIAAALRSAASAAHELLAGGAAEGATDLVGQALGHLERFAPLEAVTNRLRALEAELEDLASELRQLVERFEEDPQRLAEVLDRRALLSRLMRKHGGSLAAVIAAADGARRQIADLDAGGARREELEAARQDLEARVEELETTVGATRRKAAAVLGPAVSAHLPALALTRAQVEVSVSEDRAGERVEFLLAANPGEPPLPLSRVASGGELARVMLALRLVLSAAPPTLVFDEVDAGIGGEAALAVGRALAELGRTHQVLVVTHLAQVAAFADHQLVVEKAEEAGRTISRCVSVEGEARVVELSRMLSGHPDSDAARRHAAELLELASASR